MAIKETIVDCVGRKDNQQGSGKPLMQSLKIKDCPSDLRRVGFSYNRPVLDNHQGRAERESYPQAIPGFQQTEAPPSLRTNFPKYC